MKPKMSFRDWCIQNHAYLLLHFYQEGNNPCAPEEIGFSAGKRVVPLPCLWAVMAAHVESCHKASGGPNLSLLRTPKTQPVLQSGDGVPGIEG